MWTTRPHKYKCESCVTLKLAAQGLTGIVVKVCPELEYAVDEPASRFLAPPPVSSWLPLKSYMHHHKHDG